jgi:hypothetical protein
MRTLDVFGPAEVFGDANLLRGGDPAYKVNIISACAGRVVSNHLGTPVHTDRTYREYRGPIDTLLVAGCMGPRELHYEPGFLDWLRLQSTRARRFGSICPAHLSWQKPVFSKGVARPLIGIGRANLHKTIQHRRRSSPHLCSRLQLLYFSGRHGAILVYAPRRAAQAGLTEGADRSSRLRPETNVRKEDQPKAVQLNR